MKPETELSAGTLPGDLTLIVQDKPHLMKRKATSTGKKSKNSSFRCCRLTEATDRLRGVGPGSPTHTLHRAHYCTLPHGSPPTPTTAAPRNLLAPSCQTSTPELHSYEVRDDLCSLPLQSSFPLHLRDKGLFSRCPAF